MNYIRKKRIDAAAKVDIDDLHDIGNDIGGLSQNIIDQVHNLLK